MRTTTITRTTKETDISIELNIDGSKKIDINTGISFLDHMLTAFAFYAQWDLTITVKGDIDVDDHHTTEDVGIVLGQAVAKALGSKKGITRFASSVTPMDEALTQVVIDVSNRPCLVFNVDFTREKLGSLSTENIKEFFIAFTTESRITLHINNQYGVNNHHIAESVFKGVGRTIQQACRVIDDSIVSTKGVL